MFSNVSKHHLGKILLPENAIGGGATVQLRLTLFLQIVSQNYSPPKKIAQVNLSNKIRKVNLILSRM